MFDTVRPAYGAVGFANGANDSAEQKAAIRRKFTSDLASAVTANPSLKVFAFLTNAHFTMGEQDAMKREAKAARIEHCDVLDRERLRIELDSPAGFFIRFQYLGIPLSEAEQASFLSRYGAQIQDVVTTGFQKVEKTLNRLLFLNEASDVLDALTFRFVLKKPYAASEIGHFRAFVFLTLREYRPDMWILWFGSSNGADRFRSDLEDRSERSSDGVGSGQWERYLPPNPPENKDVDASIMSDEDRQRMEERYGYVQTSWTSGRTRDPISVLIATYRHADTDRGDRPLLSMRDLDDGMFLPFVNASLANKIHSIQIFADGYKLNDFGPDDFRTDSHRTGDRLPGDFSDEELRDGWVRLRPSSGSSAYNLRFRELTPRRIYGHEEPADSPPPPELT